MSTVLEHDEPRAPPELGLFILARRDDILTEWENAIRRLPAARELSNPSLLDELPRYLEALGRAIVDPTHGESTSARQIVEHHTLHRLDGGFDVTEVVTEYAILRDVLMRLWSEQPAAAQFDSSALRFLHRTIDDSIQLSVARYAEAQDRATRALDRIGTANIESLNLDDLLRRLLSVLLETVPAVDTASILLREGDRLLLKASVGLEMDVADGFSVAIGEAFAGVIAAERRPRSVRNAATDPLIQNPGLRQHGVRAVYGVPLVVGGDVVGVAHIGSLTAYEFSEHDRRIFDLLAARVTSAIDQHVLRRDAERRAAELSAVIESIPDGIYIADAAGIRMANQRALDLLGFCRMADFPPGGHAALREMLQTRKHPTGEPLAESESGPALALAGRSVVQEVAITRADGQERILRTASAPITFDGAVEMAVTVATDITEAKRYEQERTVLMSRERDARTRAETAEATQRFLSEATAVLTASLEHAETLQRLADLTVPALADWCVVSSVADDGTIRIAAVAHADPAKLAVARELVERYPPDPSGTFGAPNVIRTGKPELWTHIEDELIARTTRAPDQLRMLRELGLASYLIVPLSARGRVFGTLSLISADPGRRYDQSALDLAENLAARAGLAIDNARLFREAQHAIRLREQVLAVVSHDLRNPLGAVHLGAAAIARRARGLDDPRLMKQAETIERAASRMDRMLGDLLDLASIQAGGLKVERRPDVAQAIASEAVELHEAMATEKGIRLVPELEAEPLLVECDRGRILQVLANLIGNALKFCEPGAQIGVRVWREGECVCYQVRDAGPGIPPEELRRIFDPYWSAPRPGQKGTGLGLFIARGIVEAHRGRIWAESKAGAGTTISFTIPLAQPPAPDKRA